MHIASCDGLFRLSALLLAILLQIDHALAQNVGTGLMGYGKTAYDPLCAESCLRSLTSLMLPCSIMTGGGHMGMYTPPDCRANNTAFLTSTAWCLADKCSHEKESVIQDYWEKHVTGSAQVPAKWSYFEALGEVDPKPPRYQLSNVDMQLNEPSLVDPDVFLRQWNVLGAVYHEMVMESRYR